MVVNQAREASPHDADFGLSKVNRVVAGESSGIAVAVVLRTTRLTADLVAVQTVLDDHLLQR